MRPEQGGSASVSGANGSRPCLRYAEGRATMQSSDVIPFAPGADSAHATGMRGVTRRSGGAR